jgi:hypothetical protein
LNCKLTKTFDIQIWENLNKLSQRAFKSLLKPEFKYLCWNNWYVIKKIFFLFDTVRIWEFSPLWTDFDKCHNLSKRNVELILNILSDLEPLKGSSNKKMLYSTRSCVNWIFFGTRGPLKHSFHWRFNLAHLYQKEPNLHTNSLNK